jgi:phosphoglycolate phosphatase
MKYKLIVFDWDGTLMDSEGRIVASMEKAIGAAGLAPLPPEQIRDIIGLGLLEAVQTLLPAETPTVQEGVVEHYRNHYLSSQGEPTPLFPGADVVVRELERQDYLLAVATGKSRRGLNRSLQESGLAECFQATRCADEAFSKPHPQMLLEIMDELGTIPVETLMIGDTAYDMLLAANAGAHALAVDYGVHSRERLMEHGALDCLGDVREIPDWLSRVAGSVLEIA